MQRYDLTGDAWTTYEASWMAADEADALLALLLATEPWTQRAIVAGHVEVMQPRLMSWAGALPYAYSGQTLEPRPMPPVLEALTARVAAACGAPFNHVVLNRYRHGRDKVGVHADNEWQLGRDPLIAALSLGVTRDFVLVPNDKRIRKKKKRFPLEHGSLLVMGGRIQHTWKHSVPGDTSVTGERVNLTFRELKGPPGWRQPRPDQS